MAFTIKQNDTAPSLKATLKDGSGTVIDLTNATVRFHMKAVGATTTKTDRASSVIDATNDTVGTYTAEFEVTYSDGTIETFPNDSYLTVIIRAEIS